MSFQELRTLEGPTFLLVEGDDLQHVRELTAEHVALPLSYVVGQATAEESRELLQAEIKEILAKLPSMGQSTAEEAVEALRELRAKARAMRLICRIEKQNEVEGAEDDTGLAG